MYIHVLELHYHSNCMAINITEIIEAVHLRMVTIFAEVVILNMHICTSAVKSPVSLSPTPTTVSCARVILSESPIRCSSAAYFGPLSILLPSFHLTVGSGNPPNVKLMVAFSPGWATTSEGGGVRIVAFSAVRINESFLKG